MSAVVLLLAWQSATIHVTSRIVEVHVAITDRNGVPVVDLQPEDFTVLDAGRT
ncbi:hypothetical protein SBA3_3000022 [Candidatus Sulfopaludibacter sp. SbA3]|nr:hypothetical protein SBA3_3000022 [Candidatus Sulfopaludibacter sp. SbA3]